MALQWLTALWTEKKKDLVHLLSVVQYAYTDWGREKERDSQVARRWRQDEVKTDTVVNKAGIWEEEEILR